MKIYTYNIGMMVMMMMMMMMTMMMMITSGLLTLSYTEQGGQDWNPGCRSGTWGVQYSLQYLEDVQCSV